MIKQPKSNNAGFTIIELMIATVVFSLILLLCSYTLISIARTYYKGITATKTQQAARDVTDQLTQAIQFSGSVITTATGTPIAVPGNGNVTFRALCVGTARRYSYVTGFTLHDNPDTTNGSQQIKHVIWADDDPSSCMPLNLTQTDPGGTNGRELLGSFMRLDLLSLSPASGSGGDAWDIDIRVLTGDKDLLTGSPGSQSCISNSVGGQFCAFSELQTTALRRLQ